MKKVKKVELSKMEGDKIISDFMGIEVYEDKDHDILWTGDLADETLECIDYTYNFNSIMTVVNKIESLRFGVDFYTLFDVKNLYHVEIRKIDDDGGWGEGDDWIVNIESGPTKVMAIWNAVILFIKWYNNREKLEKKLTAHVTGLGI